jgi:putative tricarboxylic transport membrane protein
MTPPDSRALLSRKAMELGFAGLLLAFGGVIAFGARELETGWGSSGPEAGYFPFRIGLLLMGVSSLILLREALRAGAGHVFLARRDLRSIGLFLLPLIGLCVAIPGVGFYVAASAYLAIAIGLVGRAGVRVAAAVALCVPGALFLLFEFVFRTPLPKGPLGPLLGMM